MWWWEGFFQGNRSWVSILGIACVHISHKKNWTSDFISRLLYDFLWLIYVFRKMIFKSRLHCQPLKINFFGLLKTWPTSIGQFTGMVRNMFHLRTVRYTFHLYILIFTDNGCIRLQVEAAAKTASKTHIGLHLQIF